MRLYPSSSSGAGGRDFRFESSSPYREQVLRTFPTTTRPSPRLDRADPVSTLLSAPRASTLHPHQVLAPELDSSKTPRRGTEPDFPSFIQPTASNYGSSEESPTPFRSTHMNERDSQVLSGTVRVVIIIGAVQFLHVVALRFLPESQSIPLSFSPSLGNAQ